MAKQTIVAAISPVSCGQIKIRLWVSGSGLAIAPVACSIVKGPKVLTDGVSSVVVDSLNR